MSKDSIFSGMSDASKQNTLNMAGPVLQENAETMSGDMRFAELRGRYDNHAAKGGQGQAEQEAQNLNAYKQRPQDLMNEHRRRMENKKVETPLWKQIPLWAYAIGGIALWRASTMENY